MSFPSPPPEAVRSLVRAVAQHAPFEMQPPLLEQAGRIEYVRGPVTMMELRVSAGCAPVRGVPSPVPGSPRVVDGEGNDIGGLYLWLDSDGYIDSLEYFWMTVEMPDELPSPDQVRGFPR